jgi:hypothetical protein
VFGTTVGVAGLAIPAVALVWNLESGSKSHG